ncbi:MAG: transaldolase family protein [Vicinamibacterales bacterium]
MTLTDLRTHIYADGAELDGMLAMYAKPYIKGFTTNPTLMRKAGITDYRAFAHQVLAAIPDRPISFEVFSDEVHEMERQARDRDLGRAGLRQDPGDQHAPRADLRPGAAPVGSGVKVNVTALMTLDQVRAVTDALRGGAPANISVFAGRIADTGRDPVPHMRQALEIMTAAPNAALIWASPRELLNVFQAHEIGCHIITVTNDILKKLALVDKDLDDYSLETVRMFHDDARAAGYQF